MTISCLKVSYLSLFYLLFIFSFFLLLRLSPVAQADPELPIVKTGLEFLILLSLRTGTRFVYNPVLSHEGLCGAKAHTQSLTYPGHTLHAK